MADAARIGVALLGIVGLGWLSAAAPPRPARHAPAVAGDRVIVADGTVRSVLRIAAPMRYGEWRWNEAGVPTGRLWVRIDRAAQLLSVFRGRDEIGTAVILYGAPEKPTPAGHYPVLGKEALHHSRSYDAAMPYTLWLTRNGVGIHASSVRAGAATHGCVGLPEAFARRLFEAARVGDEVVIV